MTLLWESDCGDTSSLDMPYLGIIIPLGKKSKKHDQQEQPGKRGQVRSVAVERSHGRFLKGKPRAT